MTLSSSGAISLSAIQTEFGGSSPAAISNYYRGGTNVPNLPVNAGIPTSGTIQLDDFYNGSKGTATWTTRSLPTTPLYVRKGAYSGSAFVIAGPNSGASGGIIYSSPDGATWTQSGTSTNVVFRAVGSNGSGFVVIGTRSSDSACVPLTATSSTGPYTVNANLGTGVIPADIAYSSSLGLYVLVCNAGLLYTSPTGVTWTNRTSSFSTTDILGVTWNGSVFVAVGRSGKIATSSNATTWTQQTNAFAGTAAIEGIAWNGSVFVATCDLGTPTVATSPDGVTWTSRGTVVKGLGVGNSTLSGVPIFLTVTSVGTSPQGGWSFNGATWYLTTKTVLADSITDVIGGSSGRFVVIGSNSAVSAPVVYTVDIA